ENCYVKRILWGLPCVPTRWPLAPDDIETAYTAVVVHTVWIAIPVWRIICAAAVIVPVDLFERDLIGHEDSRIVVAPLAEVGQRCAGGRVRWWRRVIKASPQKACDRRHSS